MNLKYVLIAPDGEFMDGEAAKGNDRGRPIPGHTDANGNFAYSDKPKGIGVYALEIPGPFVARLVEDPAGGAKGNIVCKRLDGSSAFDVIVALAELGDPRRKLRATIFDRFGEPRRQTEIEVIFSDGTRVTTTSNNTGEFVIEMERPQEIGKIRYNLSNEEPSDVVFFEEFFIDVKSINTDEGVRRRLHNLGYLINDDLRGALLTFQAVHGLDTTGEVDEVTLAKLQAVHDGDEPLVPEFILSESPLGPADLIEEGPPP